MSDTGVDIEAAQEAQTPTLGSERDPFARTLRTAGALLLAISASTFMFQHWSERDDIERYWMLLAHTTVIVVSALLCGSGLRAARSARTLFGLVLASLPVHFTVLGALIYSGVGAASAGLPGAAIWRAPSLASALLTALGAVAVLAPAGWIALRVLARAHARWLAAVTVCVNAALLVPVRAPTIVGFLLLACAVALLHVDGRFARHHELRTFEGRACRLLCFVPLFVIAARALVFYDVTAVFVATTLLAAAWGWSSLCARPGFGRNAVIAQRLATVPVLLAAGVLAQELADGSSLALYFVALSSALLVAFGHVALGGRGFHYATAGHLGCFVVLLDAWQRFTPGAALIALLVGAAVMALAAMLQRIGLLLTAGTTTLIALVLELQLVIDVSALGHWGALASAGLLLILGAAVLERHGRELARRAHAVRASIDTWGW